MFGSEKLREIQAQLDAAIVARDEAVQNLSTVSAERDDARAQLGTVTTERDNAQTALTTAQTDLKAANDQIQTLTKERDDAVANATKAKDAVQTGIVTGIAAAGVPPIAHDPKAKAEGGASDKPVGTPRQRLAAAFNAKLA